MAITNYLVPVIGGGLLMTTCWLLGFYGFSFLWISAIVMLSVLNSQMWRRRERRVIALRQAALKEKEVVLAQLRDLPAWVQFPDTERVEWLNRVIFQIWPYLGEFTRSFIKEKIEPGIRAHLPMPFRSFGFESIDMGDIPLRVGGIKVYRENVGRDRIIMDMDVAYAGDCEFVVSVGVFKAGLRQMQFKGKLRAILKPLLPRPPFVGAVSVFLLDEPSIDFDLTGLGELVELPGLLGAVRSVISSQVASICVLPNEIVVPLTSETDIVKLYFPEPDGVVRIHILEAKNLEDRDVMLKGKSDPYARISVGAQNHKTKTIDNSLDPVWDEYFEAVVDQASGQRVSIELFDEDVASADEFLGRIALELSVVRERGVVDEWYPLEGVKHGDLHLRLFWMDLSTEPSRVEEKPPIGNGPVTKSKKGAPKPSFLSSALLMAYVDNISDLPNIRKDVEPTPYLELTVGKHTHSTYPRPKTPNPLYQQKFVFFVTNVDSQTLKVEAKDEAAGGRSLGEMTFAIRQILDEERLELYQHKFYLSLGPHGSPLVMTLRLRFLRQGSSEAPVGLQDVQDGVPSQSPYRPYGNEYGTNQLILPTLDLNGGSSSGKEAWRGATLSPGAITPNDTKAGFASRMISRFTRSNSKLRGKRRRVSRAPSPAAGHGRLELSAQFLDDKKQLVLCVHRAENLLPCNDDDTADPYLKARLMKDGSVLATQKTEAKRNTLNPRFGETFTFDLDPIDWQEHIVAFDVKDSLNYGLFARRPVLGQLFFDLVQMDGKRIHQWFPLARPCYDTKDSTLSLKAQ